MGSGSSLSVRCPTDIPYNETIEAKAGVNAENSYRGDEYKKDPSYEAFAYGA